MIEKDTKENAVFNFDFSDNFKINKRVGVRYPAPKVSLTLLKKNLLNIGTNFTGQLIDISAKGALIKCDKPLTKNTALSIKIIFAEGTKFNLKGNVVREKSPHQYGIEFERYNPILDEYLYKLLAESPTK